jgi:hypothetical protein
LFPSSAFVNFARFRSFVTAMILLKTFMCAFLLWGNRVLSFKQFIPRGITFEHFQPVHGLLLNSSSI